MWGLGCADPSPLRVHPAPALSGCAPPQGAPSPLRIHPAPSGCTPSPPSVYALRTQDAPLSLLPQCALPNPFGVRPSPTPLRVPPPPVSADGASFPPALQSIDSGDSVSAARCRGRAARHAALWISPPESCRVGHQTSLEPSRVWGARRWQSSWGPARPLQCVLT